VAARGAAVVRLFAHRAIDLGGDDDVLAGNAEILQRLAEQPFGVTEGVDVGGVDEIDAGGQRPRDNRIGRRLVDIGDGTPGAAFLRRAECHGAEADFGDEQAGISKLVVTHDRTFLVKTAAIADGWMKP
jgi:hypothetical protein